MNNSAFVNYAVWESAKKYKDAFKKYASPEVQSNLLEYPDSSVASPHLFKKVAVTDICVG